MTNRLLVIISDRLSDLVRKGEVTQRYYNPGDVFDEVHLLQINDDRPDPAAVQPMVGDARLLIHNLPAGLRTLLQSLAWRPPLLRGWADRGVHLARELQPSLVRCYGAHLNAFAAYEIRKALGIPYVVSLHINPDEDVRGRARGLRQRLLTRAIVSVEKASLRNADLVLPVYEPIVPFLERLGITRFEVVHNALNPISLQVKATYALHDPVRIVSVGRQIAEKNPENIIRALAQIPNADLTLVGDGPLHNCLKQLASEVGVRGRVSFRRAVGNDELCHLLAEQDIFCVHSEYWEISKAVLEALLTGLPVVVNRRIGKRVPELRDDLVALVDNTPAAYAVTLRRLIEDGLYREQLGCRAFAYAHEHWAPEKMEARVAAIYRDFLAARAAVGR